MLAVRVVDTAGQGGWIGKPEEVRLAVAKGGDSLPLAGEWKLRVGLDARRFPPLPAADRNAITRTRRPSSGTAVNPIVPFGVRGALWYQGEQSRPRRRILRLDAGADRGLAPSLQAIPFLSCRSAVQLRRHARRDAELRQAQLQTMKVPHRHGVTMASATRATSTREQAGAGGDCRSGRHEDVGRRDVEYPPALQRATAEGARCASSSSTRRG